MSAARDGRQGARADDVQPIEAPEEAGLDVRTAPLIETGDERYVSLSDVQAVGFEAPTRHGIAYDVYRLL